MTAPDWPALLAAARDARGLTSWAQLARHWGLRYQSVTECANGHPPTEALAARLGWHQVTRWEPLTRRYSPEEVTQARAALARPPDAPEPPGNPAHPPAGPPIAPQADPDATPRPIAAPRGAGDEPATSEPAP